MFLRCAFTRHFSKVTNAAEIIIPKHKIPYKTRELKKIDFTSDLISHLEKLSLVRFSNEDAVINLREAVARADRLLEVNVEGLDEMDFVWEDLICPMHDDVEEKPLTVEKALSNASETVEDYFVTPPGNVPLEDSDVTLNMKVINK